MPGRGQNATGAGATLHTVVRSLSKAPLHIFRADSIVPPRAHGYPPAVTMLSAFQAPFPVARLDADRAGARLLSPGTDADR
jgi:hypothetical protein